MKMLMLAPMPPAAEGGGAIPVLMHAEIVGLAERHQLTLVTAIGDEPWEAQAVETLEASGLDLHLVDRRQPDRAGARWRRRLRLAAGWARGGRPWRTVWFADPGFQPVIDALADRRFDVVAIEDGALSGFRLPAGVPSVYTHQEVVPPRGVDWRPGPPSSWPGWAFRELDQRRLLPFQRQAWNHFDLARVFSEGDAEMVARLDPAARSRIRVDPFGIELPEPADPASEVGDTVLFVGNFTHPPNRDAAAWIANEIMPAVAARRPQAKLAIVGTAPPPKVLELACERVEVIGDAPSVRPHLERAAVVLAPVRTGGGMRMKVLEAIATGKAVVTTALGTEGFTGFGEEPPMAVAENAAGLAAAAAGLLGDDGARRSLAARARSFAERHHSPQAFADRTTAVFEEAVASGSGGARGR